MRIPHRRCRSHGDFRYLAVVVLGIAIIAPARLLRSDEPPVFAITNARIFPVTGRTVEKGTVVIRNGIIESVGASVSIPADARRIDAAGLTVYPGLIDSLCDVGLEEARTTATIFSRTPGRPSTTPSTQTQQQQPSQTPDERQGLTPYVQASDILNPASQKIEAARSAGITTALVAPRKGFFQGQSSLINLSGGSIGQMVVKTPVALHISLAGTFGFGGGYPGSLMGVVAFVRQTLMDAQNYAVAWKIYSSNPGARRPEFSRALQALLPALKQEDPVIIPGDTPAQIQRALDLSAVFNLRLVLAGGAEAGKVASLIKRRNVPLLLSAKFPERDRDADPDLEEELTLLRRRVMAPANAAELAKAGVLFAFQSDDMASPRDFMRNVGRAVEAGLDRAAALRALTLTPAEIFGVADRLGSIERGKTANLTLATGDLFDARTRIKFVFIDGQKFEITESEPGPAAESRKIMPAADASPQQEPPARDRF